jgi:hypothetical protein
MDRRRKAPPIHKNQELVGGASRRQLILGFYGQIRLILGITIRAVHWISKLNLIWEENFLLK